MLRTIATLAAAASLFALTSGTSKAGEIYMKGGFDYVRSTTVGMIVENLVTKTCPAEFFDMKAVDRELEYIDKGKLPARADAVRLGREFFRKHANEANLCDDLKTYTHAAQLTGVIHHDQEAKDLASVLWTLNTEYCGAFIEDAQYEGKTFDMWRALADMSIAFMHMDDVVQTFQNVNQGKVPCSGPLYALDYLKRVSPDQTYFTLSYDGKELVKLSGDTKDAVQAQIKTMERLSKIAN